MTTNNKNQISEFAIRFGTDPLSLTRLARAERQVALGAMIADAGQWLRNQIKAVYRRRATERELMRLSDQMLADIGIRRDEIPAIAAGRLQRQETPLSLAIKNAGIAFFGDKAPATATVATETPSEKPLAA